MWSLTGSRGLVPLTPLMSGVAAKDVTCYTSIMLKSTALGLRGGIANPCDSGQSLPFFEKTHDFLICPFYVLCYCDTKKS